jgi:hypothetical protein
MITIYAFADSQNRASQNCLKQPPFSVLTAVTIRNCIAHQEGWTQAFADWDLLKLVNQLVEIVLGRSDVWHFW